MTQKSVPLLNKWAFYYDEKPSRLQTLSNCKQSPYKPLGTFDTVQGFWGYWNNIDIAKLPTNSNLRLFKASLSPYPEDPVNLNGGKWVVACDKNETISQTWLISLLALIGEQYEACDQLCGSVLTLGTRNTISIWIKTLDKKILETTEREICQFLQASRDRMRFQRNRDPETKAQKSFCIKLSRSVDLTNTKISDVSLHIETSVSQTPLPLPNVSQSSTSSISDDEEFTTPYIELTKDFSKPNSQNTACSTSVNSSVSQDINSFERSSSLNISNSAIKHRKSLSEQGKSSRTPKEDDVNRDNKANTGKERQHAHPRLSNSRLAVSIDSASFRRWRTTELVYKPVYQLPKLYRRRGRRISTDQGYNGSPRPHRLSITPSIPCTIPENKVVDFEETNRDSSKEWLGIAFSHWIMFFSFVLFLVIGSYVYSTLFLNSVTV